MDYEFERIRDKALMVWKLLIQHFQYGTEEHHKKLPLALYLRNG
jgi:hypothetical protein